MRSRNASRATPIAVLPHLWYRRTAIVILLIAVACLVIPAQAFAYTETMFETVVGSCPPVIVQNQSYTTSTRQDLFHTATNAATDTEAFAFSGLSPAGIQLAQTASLAAAGTESGFFRSTASSDLVAPVHIGNGYLGTWIGDPLWTGLPIFAGLTFPAMTKTDVSQLASMPQGLGPAVSGTKGNATGNKSAAAPGNVTGNKTKLDTVAFRPVINNALNDTLADQSARNATAAATAGTANAMKNESAKSATPKPSPMPSPPIKKGEPFYHQQNKPFSTALTTPSGPFKATAASTANTTGFDRFLRNTVGRSTTDKAFDGTTSAPVYIHPADALAVQIPYDFIQGARGMTMPGTHLNYRAWPL